MTCRAQVWAGCALALAGTLLITAEEAPGAMLEAGGFGELHALVAAAAACACPVSCWLTRQARAHQCLSVLCPLHSGLPSTPRPDPAALSPLPLRTAGGDAALLAAALFYSLHVVRVSGYSQSLPPAQLATGKSVVIGGLAAAALAVAAGGAVGQVRT